MLNLGQSGVILEKPAKKARFDDIYIQNDPREYYRVLYGLDYIIPGLARSVFRDVARSLELERGRPLTVLDIGCSYGTNGILLRTPLDFHRLAQRYADLGNCDVSAEKLADLDRHYLASWPRDDIRVIGLDASEPAVRYAQSVGAIDEGITANLEQGTLTADQKTLLKQVDLIISTGCIGYVTDRTFRQVLDSIDGPPPWVASFVLRMYPFDPIETELERHGLTTEKLHGVTFVQRRFHSAEECNSVIQALNARGISSEGKEDDGLYHAEFLLSRSMAEAQSRPLENVITITTGTDHSFGRRYQRDPSNNRLRLVR